MRACGEPAVLLAKKLENIRLSREQEDYEQALRETPVDQAIEFTLSDWDYLGGEISFEAEEATDLKRGKRLNGVHSRIEELLAAYYTHEEPV